MNLRTPAHRCLVALAVLGFSLFLLLRKNTTYPQASLPAHIPQKSTAAQSAFNSQNKGKHASKGPYARTRLVEDAPRIGEAGRVPSGIFNQLGLSDEEAALAEGEIVKMRQRMVQLVLDHTSVEEDGSTDQFTIDIAPFEESANAELENFLTKLSQLLGSQKSAALFSYLDTESEFSAYGKFPVKITIKPENKGRPIAIRYNATTSGDDKAWGKAGMIFEDTIKHTQLIDGYDNAFDTLVAEFFTPIFERQRMELEKRDEERRALVLARKAAAVPPAQKPSPPKIETLPEVKLFTAPQMNQGPQYSGLFPIPNGSFGSFEAIDSSEKTQELQRWKTEIRKKTLTQLAERARYDFARSKPVQGYEVYSIRAGLDLGNALLKEQREGLAKLFEDENETENRLRHWTYENFPYGTIHLSRDTLLEVTRKPDGTIEKMTIRQTDAKTGTFVSSGERSEGDWLLKELGLSEEK